jgi:hypothetical protein
MRTTISKQVYKKVALSVLVLILVTSNATPQQGHMKDKYLIDNKSVSKNEFEVFLAKLKQVPGTWFCAETSKGGVTGYDVGDNKGGLYSYKSESSSNGSLNTLTSKRK